ncbi:hypothetical protein Javan226_0027 [Streptococcus phage Javan226]|uniref:Uncharacterized protein n=1 Tax=Streptococcus gallolyticus TaxID=315405 RepID=A0A139R3R8_9STRE|nr:hypothetical protein [Streptococcus gallolyticus]KXU09408.1 hypothetical protein SGADD03_00813 [Streptococcus gallolyticus]QBX25046.1 hypothetical protein Javan226_0027 [Streptococcus phage Javan226]
MFDLWENLKYKVKKECHWLKQNVRQFFCKHHYVEVTLEKYGLFGYFGIQAVKCTKCGKTTEKEDWMTIYGKKN